MRFGRPSIQPNWKYNCIFAKCTTPMLAKKHTKNYKRSNKLSLISIVDILIRKTRTASAGSSDPGSLLGLGPAVAGDHRVQCAWLRCLGSGDLRCPGGVSKSCHSQKVKVKLGSVLLKSMTDVPKWRQKISTLQIICPNHRNRPNVEVWFAS